MTCKEVDEFLDSDRSDDFTSPEWEAVEAHAKVCAHCFLDMVQAEADSDELYGIIIDRVSEEEWRKLFKEAGQPPEVIEEALREIREEQRKRT